MAEHIGNLLKGRTDLSPYLVHFTCDTKFQARENLLSILVGWDIKARTYFGMAKALVNELGTEQSNVMDKAGLSQKVVSSRRCLWAIAR